MIKALATVKRILLQAIQDVQYRITRSTDKILVEQKASMHARYVVHKKHIYI